ncbi:MAG: hypothetical protein GY870_08250 [archaeon]|nr:hypothetical protein [archaeon]
MARKKKTKTPLAILTADWHIRESIPTCRTDNFYQTQKRKLEWIAELSHEYEIPVILAGDLFHKWKTSPQLESLAIECLSGCYGHGDSEVFCIPGNHDLANHSITEIKRSSYFVVYKSNVLAGDWFSEDYLFPGLSNVKKVHIHPFAFGEEIKNVEKKINNYNVCIAHQLTYDSEKPWADCKADSAKQLLKKYDGYDLIVVGDNHQSFVTEYEGRLLVNPGCITRQTGAFVDFKPSVYIWYSDNTVERKYIPIEKEVINRDHLKKAEERNEKLDAFVETLKDNKDIDLNFIENLKKYVNSNDIKDKIVDKLWEHVEV